MEKKLLNSGVEYVSLSGHLNGLNAEKHQQSLEQLLEGAHCSTLVADMAAVESMDSAGLMALVSVLNTAQECGKTFALTNVPQPIQIILELSKFDQVVDVVDGVIQPKVKPEPAIAA
ncbi:MAG: STAS domain-containing protein [Leptolyngbyaceae bacterium]|nr:STAS domain-containing protein [Leptolyngbyaceae bacterium]